MEANPSDPLESPQLRLEQKSLDLMEFMKLMGLQPLTVIQQALLRSLVAKPMGNFKASQKLAKAVKSFQGHPLSRTVMIHQRLSQQELTRLLGNPTISGLRGRMILVDEVETKSK